MELSDANFTSLLSFIAGTISSPVAIGLWKLIWARIIIPAIKRDLEQTTDKRNQ